MFPLGGHIVVLSFDAYCQRYFPAKVRRYCSHSNHFSQPRSFLVFGGITRRPLCKMHYLHGLPDLILDYGEMPKFCTSTTFTWPWLPILATVLTDNHNVVSCTNSSNAIIKFSLRRRCLVLVQAMHFKPRLGLGMCTKRKRKGMVPRTFALYTFTIPLSFRYSTKLFSITSKLFNCYLLTGVWSLEPANLCVC